MRHLQDCHRSYPERNALSFLYPTRDLRATLIRFIVGRPFPNPKGWFTQVHFDLLVDYHIRVCEGSDYDAVENTFTVLTWLRGSPSTQDRKRRYIDTMIRFMGQKETYYSALNAVCSVPTALTSVDDDDESLRERFSKTLASAIMQSSPWANATLQAPLDSNPFNDIDIFRWNWDIISYLKLLCTLSKEPVWQLQLLHNGHFDNCLVIADTLSAREGLDGHVVYVAHILANIDASGAVHPFYASVQAYPSWPLILRAWRYIFSMHFGSTFENDSTSENDWTIAPTNHLEALSSLLTYSKNRYEDKNAPLIMLVQQFCQKLDEKKQQHERDEAEGIQLSSRQGSRVLAKKIMVLLESAL